MTPLNLPPFEYRLRKAEGKLWIFDVIRKKYTVLFPEEWVRQHVLNYLVVEMNYPKSLIKVETGLHYNQRVKRSDVVIFDREGKPWMVIECKAPDVVINDKSVFQVATYNATLKARYIMVTNGLRHFFAEVNWEAGTTQVLDQIPSFEQQAL